jgi:DNA-binding SARP family transcriptional activator
MPNGQRNLRVSLLGRFEVSVGPRVINEDGWRLRKAASVVKLLALAPAHSLHREQVMNLLWPDLGARAAANNLHQALHVARRILEPETTAYKYLPMRGEQLTLCSEDSAWVDVKAFEMSAREARGSRQPAAYREALHLYSGDLLPRDRYEEWAERRRDELRRTYLALLFELSTVLEERGALDRAVEALQEIVSREPAHEEARVGLMRVYSRAGQRYRALRQNEQLRRTLRRELGTEPHAASRYVYGEILAGHVPVLSSISPEQSTEAVRHNLTGSLTSFVGREREKDEVERMLATTRLLTLTGAGGSGKTRLAQEIARDLTEAYPDGAWLVELAAISEGSLVQGAVAEALDVREQPGVQPRPHSWRHCARRTSCSSWTTASTSLTTWRASPRCSSDRALDSGYWLPAVRSWAPPEKCPGRCRPFPDRIRPTGTRLRSSKRRVRASVRPAGTLP